MPTNKPRIQVTLDEETYIALKEYSFVTGQSMSSFTSQVLRESASNLKLLTKVLQTAKGLQDDALKAFVEPLKHQSDRAEGLLNELSSSLENFSGEELTPLVLTRGSGGGQTVVKSKKQSKKLWLASSNEGGQ
jgi:hypothetical protein